MIHPKNLAYWAALLVWALALPAFTQVQQVDRRLKDKVKPGRLQPERTVQDRLREETQPDETAIFDLKTRIQPLEAAIDPDEYVVGPGDIFFISIWSAETQTLKVPVEPEGSLIIPTVGHIPANGRTLTEVRRDIVRAVKKTYLRAQVSVNLYRLRLFRVHVTGEVLAPGPYEALAVDRVADLIERASGLTTWASERNIEVRHRDGTVDYVDLYEYTKLGRLESNLTLRDGDVIYVPPIRFTSATVRLEGAVSSPGVYQLKENESLVEFLLRTGALNKEAELQTAYVRRRTNANGAVETIPVYPYLKQQANGHTDLTLQDGDVVMVPQRTKEVYVVGAVRTPGAYAYYPNLTAMDYVGFAGSTDRAKSLSKVKVIRKDTKTELKGGNVRIEPGDMVVVPQKQVFGVREFTTLVITVTNVLLAMKAIGVF